MVGQSVRDEEDGGGMISGLTQQRMLSFIRSVADDCKNCYFKNESRCRSCRARWAKEILHGIEFDQEEELIEESAKKKVAERIKDTLRELKEAGRPLRSIEIDMGDVPPETKYHTLREMVSRGLIIKRRLKKGKGYEYLIPPKEGKDNV